MKAEETENDLDITTIEHICKKSEVLALEATTSTSESSSIFCMVYNLTAYLEITSLPNEILEKIAKSLDMCSSTCLGLTYLKLYDVHFRIRGPAKDLWNRDIAQNYTANSKSRRKLWRYLNESMGPAFRYNPRFITLRRMVRRWNGAEERDEMFSRNLIWAYSEGTEYILGCMNDSVAYALEHDDA
jgi:hypothetical protein